MEDNPIKRLFAKQTTINIPKDDQISENIVPTYAVKAELLNRQADPEANRAGTQTTNITFDYTIVSLDDTTPNQSIESFSSDENCKYSQATLNYLLYSN